MSGQAAPNLDACFEIRRKCGLKLLSSLMEFVMNKNKENLINELYEAIEEDLEFDRGNLPFRTSKYDSLRKDETVVKLVVKRQSFNFGYIDLALRSDLKMALWVIEHVPEVFALIIDKRQGDLGHTIKTNMSKQSILKAVEGYAPNYEYLPKIWKNDLDVIRLALYLHPKFILKETPKWTREDFSLVLLAAENTHPLWIVAVIKKKWTTSQAIQLVKANPLSYEYLNNVHKNDFEVIKAAFSRSPSRKFSLDTRVMDTFELLSAKNRKNPEIAKVASEEAKLEEIELESGVWPHLPSILAWQAGRGKAKSDKDKQKLPVKDVVADSKKIIPKKNKNTSSEEKLQLAIEKVGDDLIEDVSSRLLNYLNHADEIAAALASHDMGEEYMTYPSYYRTFDLPARSPKGEEKREKAFAKFIRGNWKKIIERRLHHESDFEVDNKTEQVREFLITLMAHNFSFYLKDGHGVGINFVPRMLGIETWGGSFDDSFLHSSQRYCKDILEEHSKRLTHPDFKSQLKVSDDPSYANFGCNVVGEPTLEFFPSQNGNAYSNHTDSNQLEHEIQKLSNSLGIKGKISLKEKLTFDVVWQRKLPEVFYPLKFHTKKIRIFD